MGFIDNKYVKKFTSGGLPPAEFRQASAAQDSPPSLPPGWVQRWDASNQRWYYLEQATGNTQLEPPAHPDPAQSGSNHDADGASMMSGITANTVTPLTPGTGTTSSSHQMRMNHSHKWMNMPTAAERAEYWRKEKDRQDKEGDKKPCVVPGIVSVVMKY